MNIGILGTGVVGQTIATKLVSLGHRTMLGSRTANNQKAIEWKQSLGDNALTGTFEDAAKCGDVIFLATKGDIALDVITLAGIENFAGKTVIDISNPLDFSNGFPPSLSICNTNSLGEEVQKALPDANIVKTLNTLSAHLMVDGRSLKQETDIFLSGNSAQAKEEAKILLKQFGWDNPIDLGDITTARGTEQLLPIWVRLYGIFGTGNFNFKIVKG